MAFCLIPKLTEQLKKDIISGKINPDELSNMTSAERRAFFAKELGESNATPVNALFESKMILKNQQMGMISWAKKLTGISPSTKQDILSKIRRLDKVLEPAEADAFLEDLVSQRLGVKLSYDESYRIAKYAKEAEDLKLKIGEGGDRLEYGRALVKLDNYVKDLKNQAEKLTIADFKNDTGKAVTKVASTIAGNAKSINASLDNSAIFRQGWKTLWTNPTIWGKNAAKTFVDIAKSFKGNEVLDEVNAEIVSRPTYDLMKKAKLAVGLTEEAFPGTIADKIPILGKPFKASEAAYTGFVQRTRADVFDKMIKIANDTGVDLNNAELESIGKLVNSLTGRGNLGRFEPSANTFNNIFFSPRLLKSNLDFLGGQIATGAGGSNFVRKQAALNLLKVITGTATVLTIANALNPGSVEKDPRSSDFGKIKVGNTRFDVSGGMAGLVTLAFRFARNSSKSSITGKVTQLNARDKNDKPVYGGRTNVDVVTDFLANKLSPAARVIYEMKFKGQMFDGSRPTIGKEAASLVTPLPYKTFQELQKDPNAADTLLSMIAEGLGISTNTYNDKK